MHSNCSSADPREAHSTLPTAAKGEASEMSSLMRIFDESDGEDEVDSNSALRWEAPSKSKAS